VSEEQVTALSFWAVDYLGNAELPKSTANIKIDETAPVTTATVSPAPNAAGWNKSDVTVTLEAVDGLSGVSSAEYSLDGGGSWTSYPPIGILVTAEGTSTITFHASDVSGNVELPKTQVVKLDKTAPTSAATLTGSSVTLSASDAGTSGVADILYKIGTASNYITYTGQFTLGTGQTVAFHAVDKAGNVETPDKTLTNTPSDTTGPVISSILPANLSSWTNLNPGGTWSTVCSSGRVCATVTDAGSGVDGTRITYKLTGVSLANNGKCWDGSNFIMGPAGCTQPMSVLSGSQYGGSAINRNKMNAGTYSLLISAFDLAGNQSTTTVTFTVTGNP
jgi:hypothetical protein